MKTREGDYGILISMAAQSIVITGVVSGGVVVPQSDTPLPEGARVEIVLARPDIPPELRAEFDAWEQAGDEAWQMIERMEQSEP